MSEETTKDKMGELCEKLAKVVGNMVGFDVDKNTDKMLEATQEFSGAVEEFSKKIDELDKEFKAMVNLGVIIDVSFAGESKIRVVGGGRKHMTEVLDELKEQISK